MSRFESTLKSQWISSDNLADLLDSHDANYDRFDKSKASELGAANVRLSCQLFSIIFIFILLTEFTTRYHLYPLLTTVRPR